MVNFHPHLLSRAVAEATGICADQIEWVSPLAKDEYAEYRDMRGPAAEEQWLSTIRQIHRALAIPERLQHLHHIFIDVGALD
jgi:hypothetical protein